MKTRKTLILTGGHPDDESFGIGGTLAQYAAAGYNVYYVCGTRGEAGEVAPEFLKDFKSIADLRTHELETAGKALGLTGVIFLGYRDSGMAGSPENKHPNALAAAPVEQVAGRIVKILRQLKPEVVITSDPTGGYGHPDHIAMHRGTVMAFEACNDPKKYPEAGPPCQPQKLYYHVFPHRFMNFMLKVWSLLGRDIHHMGKNRDIDFGAIMSIQYPIHCSVRLKPESIRRQQAASACHASQYSGGGPRGAWLFRLANKLFGQHDYYTRVFPPVKGSIHERDLFKGVE